MLQITLTPALLPPALLIITSSVSALEAKIKDRLMTAWDKWKLGYDDWVKWSNELYTPDASISAIGDKPQKFKDYQASMTRLTWIWDRLRTL
ncbi:hypothetical protein [Paenibacillus kribbensis]|uniref:hypothetical protein n=1 Tax=Paenibacillus kribbensis TaxID=172713 RepID=UPI00114CE62D|nr:hypothetical protein [Paenibacillus kribbensis]